MAIDLKGLTTEQHDALIEVATALQEHADASAQLDATNQEIARLTKLREQLRATIAASEASKGAAIAKAQRALLTVQP